MLAENTFIDSAASLGGGQYTLNLFFQDTSKAKYVTVGDYVKDITNNEYEILSLAFSPHIDGGQATVQFITSDTLPQNDTDYDSSAYTPGQDDVRPQVRTAGVINSASVYSAPDYEYEINASWDSFAEEEKAQVDDSVVDFDGKEYVITYIDPVNRFSVAFRAEERHNEGDIPTVGACSLYRSTNTINSFQGTPISDPSRTVVRNRDDWSVDAKITEIENQLIGIGSGKSIETTMVNGSGGILIKTIPVRTDVTSKKLKTIDVSVEAEALGTLGIVRDSAANNAETPIVLAGRLEDVTISGSIEDELFVSKVGTLTNIKPEIGTNGFVAGDFIVFIGNIVQNEDNPTKKDLIINIVKRGQL